jgi:hypothetical protein
MEAATLSVVSVPSKLPSAFWVNRSAQTIWFKDPQKSSSIPDEPGRRELPPAPVCRAIGQNIG